MTGLGANQSVCSSALSQLLLLALSGVTGFGPITARLLWSEEALNADITSAKRRGIVGRAC